MDQAVGAFEKAIALDPLDALSYVHCGGTLAETARQKKGKLAADLTREAVNKLTKHVKLPRETARSLEKPARPTRF